MYKVIAHRANTDGLLENSLSAIESCVSQNVEGIELDIRHTSDHSPIIFHDQNFARLATSSKWSPQNSPLVHQLSLEEIKRDILLTNKEKIPTLQEALSLIKKKDLYIFLEMKDQPSPQTLKIIEETFTGASEKLRIISFDHNTLLKLKKENSFFSQVKMMALHEVPRTTWMPFRVPGIEGVNANLYHPFYAMYLKSLKLEVGLWWLTDKLPPTLTKTLFSYIDFFTTDNWKAW